MVGHVAGGLDARRQRRLAQQICDQRHQRLFQDRRQQGEAAAMHAAHQHLFRALAHALADDTLDHGEETIAAGQAEHLGAGQPALQNLLQRMAACQQAEQGETLFVGGRCGGPFRLRLQPGAFFAIMDMAEFPADGAAIGGTQSRVRSCRQTIGGGIELRHRGRFGQAQRVEPRRQMATMAPGLGQQRHAAAGNRGRRQGIARLEKLRQPARHVARHAVRIVEELPVERVERPRIPGTQKTVVWNDRLPDTAPLL